MRPKQRTCKLNLTVFTSKEYIYSKRNDSGSKADTSVFEEMWKRGKEEQKILKFTGEDVVAMNP